MQALVSEQFLGDLSKTSLLAFGWAHPIAQAAGAAVAIVLAAQAVAGESETGTIELTLGQPLARRTYLAAHVVFALAALALVTLAGLAGTLAGGRAYGLAPFDARELARLGLDYFALLGALFGLTLAFSAFGREGGRVALAGFLVALVSYLVHVIGSMWAPWERLVPWTLHAYYVPARHPRRTARRWRARWRRCWPWRSRDSRWRGRASSGGTCRRDVGGRRRAGRCRPALRVPAAPYRSAAILRVNVRPSAAQRTK